METTQYTLEPDDSMPDFWTLSDRELAAGCIYVAEGRIAGSKLFLRAEAMRLFLMWRETVYADCLTREDVEQRACCLAGLRKRTIQILAGLSLVARERSRPS